MNLKISRILHAGYLFEFNQTQIVFDPIFENPFSRNCYSFPSVQFDLEKIKQLKFSAVFISHYHDDHCSMESLNLIDRATPIYMYCIFDEMLALIQRLGFKNVYSLQLDVPVIIGDMTVIPRKALDIDVDSIFQIKAAGLNILNVVDSWIDPETLELLRKNKPWDIVLWPFQTMREIEVLSPSRSADSPTDLPFEWIEQLQILSPRYIVPSSCQFVQENWSWYNQALFPISYQRFQEQMASVLPSAQVVRLNPGVCVELDQKLIQDSIPLDWIKPIGDQNVDYQFSPNLKPPTTAEISKNFPALLPHELEKVFEYCQSGMIKKFHSFEPAVHSYFQKERIWRLSLYDHQGVATHFNYKVDAFRIEQIKESDQPLSWSTELPIYKLFGAIEYGEALTSMYVRINDIIFNSEVEQEMESVDLIEDPLIRSLFSNSFGAYQIGQLKRLGL